MSGLLFRITYHKQYNLKAKILLLAFKPLSA
jgi:hypothetical protein